VLDALDADQRELLSALVTPHGWIPDFLTPPPTTPLPDIAEELRALRATPLERMLADLELAADDGPLHPLLARGRVRPDALRDRIADVVEAYWRHVIEPEWPRMRAVLESDVTYRSLQLARGGAAALFGDLDPRVRWREGVLCVDASSRLEDVVVAVAGRGLPLVPTIFAPHAITLVAPDQLPMVAYPARGRAALGLQHLPVAPEAVAALLGRPRATVLALLEHPATTTELAARLRVTPSAVNQHLRALAAAGLLGRVRSGRAVLYARTPLAEAWLGSAG